MTTKTPRPGGAAPRHQASAGRRRARGWRPLAAGLLLAATVPLAASADPPRPSGLPWLSGSTAGDCLAGLRGRPLDVLVNFVTHTSFQAMVSKTALPLFQQTGGAAPLWVVSLPLLDDQHAGQFAACAGGNGTGAFDGYWRQIGANLGTALQAAGRPTMVVRLGWEANIGHSHAWAVSSPAQIPAYKACWRQAAAQLRAGAATTAPGARLQLEWANAKKTNNTAVHVLDMYPGDDVVDLWGVHYYDSGPIMNTDARWTSAYWRTFNGGPWGLGTWLQAAQAHGRKLAVSEWAVWQRSGQTAAQADDPVYVDHMYRFFQANADSIAYESYFNAPGGHAFCPTTGYPNAAARYQADWQQPALPPGTTRARAR